MTYSVVDLFSGAGGMSYGFHAHPSFTIVGAADAQIGKPSSGKGALDCNSSYEENIGIKPIEKDLGLCGPEELGRDLGLGSGDIFVLSSCAPCTGFSRAVPKNHVNDDPRNSLVYKSADFVEYFSPEVFVMENARELLMGRFKHHFKSLKERLCSLGYDVHGSIHMLSSFGLPQIRERSLIVAAKKEYRLRTIKELWQGYVVRPESTTVRHAIYDMPAVGAGQTSLDDPMHVSPRVINESTRRRLELMPKDGGSWRDLVELPEADFVLTPAMKRSVEKNKLGSHPDVYGRLWWDRPCVTIKRECSHVGNGRYSHPEQDRLCTVREMALMQGFPRTYKLCGNLANMYRHIGDAVPPIISYQLANLVDWILTGKKPEFESLFLEDTCFTISDIQKDRGPKQLQLAEVM